MGKRSTPVCAHAKGMYYKVVDSDDWLDLESLKKVMDTIRRIVESRKRVDLLICNYVYEHVEDNQSHVVRYDNVLPEIRFLAGVL